MPKSEARKQYEKEWKEANREQYLASLKEWRENHKEELKEYKARWFQENKSRIRSDRNAKYQVAKETWPELIMWEAARGRAKRKKLPFNIEVSDIIIPEVCPVLGLSLEINKGTPKSNSPVLDKIENDKGYVKGNVRVISSRANRIKSDLTVDQVEKLYRYCKKEI